MPRPQSSYKLDLELPVSNRPNLANQLTQPRCRNGAIALLVSADAMGIPRWLAFDWYAEHY